MLGTNKNTIRAQHNKTKNTMKSYYITPKIYFTEEDLKRMEKNIKRKVTEKDLTEFVIRSVSHYLDDLHELAEKN